VLATEGVKGLYKAYFATVLSFGPFQALYFMFYEKFKEIVLRWEGAENMGFFESMVASWVAGGCASTLTNPLDLAKLRLQVQRASSSSGEQAF
jgi:hypothetical protein